VELSHELLGAETVVLMTIPFTNNVLTADDMNEVNLINANMRHIAQGWHLRNSSGVKKVLVLEYGTYHNHIIWSNARHIGYNVSAPLLMTQEMFDLEVSLSCMIDYRLIRSGNQLSRKFVPNRIGWELIKPNAIGIT
jgi:hypothetical protein